MRGTHRGTIPSPEDTSHSYARIMEYIKRKSLLYKTEVDFGDYAANHVLGCSHGCTYPCYAMMMAKRFGRVKTYDAWIQPKIVMNAEELLREEIPRYKNKITSVHFCFTTDPFMYGYKEIADLSMRLIAMLNDSHIKCTILTKGCLPMELAQLSSRNECGITLMSLNEDFRKDAEPFSAPYRERIGNLYQLHKRGLKTWVSIEPYPTPNILQQNIEDILDAISFADKIIFGRMNYNAAVSEYKNHKEYFNQVSNKVIDFCRKHNKEYHIKKGTIEHFPGLCF